MFDLENLKRIKEDSLKVHNLLKELNAIVDSQMTNLEGMCDISQRVNEAFTLYRTLVMEIETQTNEGSKTEEY
jgi:hypothetical protein